MQLTPLPVNHPVLVAMRFLLSARSPGGCLFGQSLHHPQECADCAVAFAVVCLEGRQQTVQRWLDRHPGLEPVTLPPSAPETRAELMAEPTE